MYNSKYYTCEQIDQRLLEGYYDDAVAAGYTGSKAQYLAGLLKAINYSANPTITADKVVYNPAISGLTPKNIQDAIDELANKKANSEDVDSKIQTEQERVNAELDKKFDKENIAQEFGDSDDKVVSQFALPFREIESQEFIKAIVDAEDHFLFGIQLDGSIEWGKGIPVPIRAKLQEIINQCQQDKTDILEAINAAKKELSASISALQEGKVDKEEGKSLIENEVKECFRIIENEEFIKAIVDSDDKVLFGFYRATGKPYYPLNEMYHVIQNKEYFAAWIDKDDKVVLGIRRDGEIIGEIHAVNALKKVISQLQSDLTSLQEKVGSIDTNLKELLDVFSLQDNHEYLAVEKDADGRILSTTNPDGSHYIYNAKSETIPEEFSHIEDPDGRMEITTDAENKVVGYRGPDGTRFEKSLEVDKIQLGTQAEMYINKQAATKIRDFDLPKYGTVNIKEETFYLTSNVGYSDANGIYAVTINEDTDSNAQNGLSIQKFYVKASLKDNGNGTYSVQEGSIPLDFYVPSKVKEVDGKYYVLSSLSELDGIYSVTDSSIEVTKITDKPTVGTWVVDKKTEHWCKVDIDFGHYLRGSFFIGVKYQGASTLYSRKRNFRFTFYTNSSYSKKDKKKIGEMIRTNSFNLKANYIDATRIKEAALYRIFIAMWEKRRKEYHNYPWRNSTTYYDCAVGMIKGFPINLSIGDDFYGIYIYGLKKDEKNYRLSDDSEGMFVSGDRSDSQCWIDGKPSDWSDEMNDEMTQSNIEALTKFLAFVNSIDFTKENVPTHLSVIDWIDYFIGMQVFVLKDSNCRNMILYSGSDKTLIYPFFYDLDNSFLFGIKDDIIETAWASDTSIWKKFISIYWDEIITRYKELRENILTVEYVKKVFASLEDNIPVGDYSQESKKWGYASTNGISLILYNFSKRLEWLDNNYFI